MQHPPGERLDRLGKRRLGLDRRLSMNGDVEQAAQLMDLGGRPSEQMLDGLELCQRLTELPSSLNVRERVLDSRSQTPRISAAAPSARTSQQCGRSPAMRRLGHQHALRRHCSAKRVR